MTDDDPFRPLDELGSTTIIRPSPGGRRVPNNAPLPTFALPNLNPSHAALPGLNPLVACASGLLTVAAQVRATLAHPDPEGLREALIGQMRTFEQQARAQGFADAVVLPARYVLCSLLDESVLDTPWGSQSVWSNRGLLISFHNESWGGEKFFTALERLLPQPSTHIALLELMYLCLALGFEGRYRVREGGRAQLERIREQLFQTIRTQRGDYDPELSPHWRGTDATQTPFIHQLPLWVSASVAALLLLALFTYFTFALNRESDPVYTALSNLDRQLPVLAERPRTGYAELPRPDAPPHLTLRVLLANELAANQLDVIDRSEGQTVILRGDTVFPSGSDQMKSNYLPVLRRIADAFKQLPGRVLITGHSDSVPIKTLRFPSNWHLSQARADQVRQLLVSEVGDPGRFTAEGRADTELLVADNPRDARNRRVEILLLTTTDMAQRVEAVLGTRP